VKFLNETLKFASKEVAQWSNDTKPFKSHQLKAAELCVKQCLDGLENRLIMTELEIDYFLACCSDTINSRESHAHSLSLN
jgi:hypothetical protein